MSSLRPEPPVENALNAMNDQDWAWWPFVELRPQASERIGTGRVLKMSVAYAPILLLLLAPILRDLPLRDALVVVAATIALTFAVWRFTFGVAWNRRAARLSRD